MRHGLEGNKCFILNVFSIYIVPYYDSNLSFLALIHLQIPEEYWLLRKFFRLHPDRFTQQRNETTQPIEKQTKTLAISMKVFVIKDLACSFSLNVRVLEIRFSCFNIEFTECDGREFTGFTKH